MLLGLENGSSTRCAFDSLAVSERPMVVATGLAEGPVWRSGARADAREGGQDCGRHVVYDSDYVELAGSEGGRRG